MLSRIIQSKLKKVLAARKRWPLFASFEEDLALRGPNWKHKHVGKRIIMWDDTNVNAPRPQDAEINRHLFSDYYGGCVAKGGVFQQLCGWMGAWQLWAGSISDSGYVAKSGILEQQKQFVADDPVHSDVPFTMILDKGHRITTQAFQSGEQRVMQPDFARSDRKFNSHEVLRSAGVATDRSGNERAVNVVKRSGLIQRGLQNHQQASTIDDAWLAWSFQVNFMFKPVL
jgi:hypothetical protein